MCVCVGGGGGGGPYHRVREKKHREKLLSYRSEIIQQAVPV